MKKNYIISPMRQYVINLKQMEDKTSLITENFVVSTQESKAL